MAQNPTFNYIFGLVLGLEASEVSPEVSLQVSRRNFECRTFIFWRKGKKLGFWAKSSQNAEFSDLKIFVRNFKNSEAKSQKSFRLKKFGGYLRSVPELNLRFW